MLENTGLHFDINIFSNAVDSFTGSLYILKNRKDDLKWKWIATGVFHSLYMLCIAGLENGNYENVLKYPDEDVHILIGNEKKWKKQRKVFHNEHVGSYTIEWDPVDYKPKLGNRDREWGRRTELI